MLSLLICALPLQGAAQAAQLHPEDALLLVDIPDVPALLEAYADAPMIRLLADKALGDSAAQISGELGVDIPAQLGAMLGQLGCPEAFVEDPLEAALGLARGARQISMSISMDAERSAAMSNELARWLEALGELAELQSTLEEAKRTTGLPSSLETLLVDDRLHTDPWGNPYVYRPDSNGAFFTLFCLGADGENGGSGAAADFAPYTSLEGMLLEESWKTFGALLVVRFEDSERASQMAGLVDGLADRAHLRLGERMELEFAQEDGSAAVADLRFFEVPNAGDAPVWSMQAGSWYALGAGRTGGGRVVQRLNDPQTPSARAFFDKHIQWLPDAEGATVVQASYRPRMALQLLRDISAVSDGDETALFDVLLQAVGDGGAMRTELVGDRFQTRYMTHEPAQLPELARCIGRTPIPPEDFAVVPPEAIGILAYSWDPGLASKVLLETMSNERDSTGRSAAQKLAAIEKRYGFSLTNDLFGNLGDSVVAYMHPLRGILSPPGIVLGLEVDNPEGFRPGLESLLTLLAESAGDDFQISSRDYRGAPTWTFSFGGGSGMSFNFSLSPTLTLVENHLLLTLSSTRAKKEIKRIVREADSDETFVAAEYLPPSEATSYAYIDWGQLVGGVYSGALSLLPILGDRVPFDPALLPSAESLTQRFRPSYSWTRSAEGVAESYYESSFGPETALGFLGVGLGFVWIRSSAAAWDEPMIQPSIEPTPKDLDVGDGR